MKAKKIPPMCTKNGLKLSESDAELREQKLEMTELEGALIAKNIIFQKIYQLPKSRWTALKDKIVNVPINEDSILNTIESVPRTPQGAGLIGVALKRKTEYKNTHKHQLINPEKLFKILSKSENNRANAQGEWICKNDVPIPYGMVVKLLIAIVTKRQLLVMVRQGIDRFEGGNSFKDFQNKNAENLEFIFSVVETTPLL